MAKIVKVRSAPSEPRSGADSDRPFARVRAFIVALENYRKPASGEQLPMVDFANADAVAFADAIRTTYADLPEGSLIVDVIEDADASRIGLQQELRYTIRNLAADELFIFYYAGHGFHGAGGNRLSTYDTNRINIEETSLSMRDDLLEPLAESDCRQALVFVDACAEKFRGVVKSRDVITNLDPDEVEEFLDSNWYLGVFLSCSPGEKSYPAATLQHGVWTHFLLEALYGRAPQALTQNRWLTDSGLRDYLRQEVPLFITRETTIRATQTPQAIVSASGSFRIRHIPTPPAIPADAALAGIRLRNNSEFLEATETGEIRQLSGFDRRLNHTVPTQISESANSWCRRLLTERVAEELQDIYVRTRAALSARRKEVRKEDEAGGGDLDTAVFRYSVETGQNPAEPGEYFIQRRLELRSGWADRREAIDEIFGNDFDRLVIECNSIGGSFDELVDQLEDIAERDGGDVDDDDRARRATYSRDGASFTFDLNQRRVEISFARQSTLELVDAAQRFQLGIDHPSAMLPAQARLAPPVRCRPRR